MHEGNVTDKVEETYNSIFDADLKVNKANYLTEMIMSNYFAICKQDVPRTAFWRKKYKEQCDNFEWWAEKYSLDLSEVTNLLKVFPARPIAQTIKEQRIWTIKFLKIEPRKDFFYKLYQNTLKHYKECEKAAKLDVTIQPAKSGPTASFAKNSQPSDL
jgi:hypothetical protein